MKIYRRELDGSYYFMTSKENRLIDNELDKEN